MKLRTYLFLLPILILVAFSGLFAQPAAPSNLSGNAVQVDAMSFVALQWNKVDNAFQYSVYKKDGALADAGDFTRIYKGRLGSPDNFLRYKDGNVEKNHTYSYYVTAEDFNQNESGPSNKIEVVVGDVPNPQNGGIVSGTVTDASNGNPIPNVYVSVISASTYLAFVGQTDGSGHYSITATPGEDYVVYFRAPQDYWPQFYNGVAHFWEATNVGVLEGTETTGIDAALEPISMPNLDNLSGKVTDTNGDPVEAVVHIFKVGKGSHLLHQRKVLTGTDGSYTVKVREGGEYVALAIPLSDKYMAQYYNGKYTFSDADRIPVNGDVTGIDFVLESRPVYNNGISGMVKDSQGNPLKALIIAKRKDVDINSVLNNYRTFTDDNGNYSFGNLIPGDYILFAVPDEGYLPTFYTTDGTETLRWRNADPVSVGETDELTGIDFTCMSIDEASSGFAEINGKVTDNSGNPIGGAYVYVMNASNVAVAYAITDAQGNYSVDGLFADQYKVMTDSYGYTTDEKDNVSVDYNSPQSVNLSVSPDVPTGVEDQGKVINKYSLNQNYPNPFNPTTTIKYSLAAKTNVNLTVYNVLGSKVAILANGIQNAGEHEVQFNAAKLSSGIYLYELKAGNFTQIRKMILLK